MVCFCLVPCGQGFGRRLGKGFISPLLPFALLRLLAAWPSSSHVHISAIPSHLSCHVAVVRGEREQVWSKLRRPTRSCYISYIIPGWQLRAPPPQTLCCVTEATKEAHGSPIAPHQASQAAGTWRSWEERLLPAAHVLRPRRLASTQRRTSASCLCSRCVASCLGPSTPFWHLYWPRLQRVGAGAAVPQPASAPLGPSVKRHARISRPCGQA